VAQGSILAVSLLAISPTIQMNIAKITDKESLPAVQRHNDKHAKRMMFSRSPPNNKIGLVKLCNKGVLTFLLNIFYICVENIAALVSKDAAQNTMPPTAMIFVS